MMPVNQIGRPAVAAPTVKLPAKKPVHHAAVKFGEDKKDTNPFAQQPAQTAKASKGGIVHKAVTGLLAATMGLLGINTIQTANKVAQQDNTITQQNQQLTSLRDSQSQIDARRAAANEQLMSEVRALTGRTTAESGLNQERLETIARQLSNLQTQTASLASQRGFLTQMVEVVEKVTPSTVQVRGPMGLGSGVIVQDNDGRRFILTNSHVAEDNSNNGNAQRDATYTITLYSGSDNKTPFKFEAAPVVLSNGNRAQSYSNNHDLALLAIPPDVRLPAGVRAVEMRDVRETIRPGEVAVAVGSPYGNRDTVTSGIISNNDRNFSIEPNNRFLATDTPINPGNSGGGLFDMNGRLIGINTLGYRGADGLGGSIRIDVIKAVLESWGVHTMSPEEQAANRFQVQQNGRPPAGDDGETPNRTHR